MEADMSIDDILRETIAFLESLRDTQLPLTLENLRVKLLARSKNTLMSAAIRAGASSPDYKPYLDMNSGPRSILLTKNESEEYVEKEESQKQTPHQDYYETFENGITTVVPRAGSNDEEQEGEVSIGIYKHSPAAQVKSKCHKCGPLYKKEGKKLFLSEGRTRWVALVGSHLLIYRSERHNRPASIYSIRGYMARPAPNLIPRDRQRSESAFEIYRPGSETLQFIARTPKDRDQWVAKVCEMGTGDNEDADDKAEGHEKQIVVESSVNRKDTTRRSVKEKSDVAADGTKTRGETTSGKKTVAERGKAPPLPARIPRKLPSLPLSVSPLEYSNTTIRDDDDDDDIYHKIEDLKNEIQYQNLRKKRAAGGANEQNETARDDFDERHEEETANTCGATLLEEMYDDVTLSRINATTSVGQRARNNDRPVASDDEIQEDLYDDVENLIPNGKFGKDRAKKDQVETSPSKLQKKSFLERVLSRRESSGKTEKCKSKASLESAAPVVSAAEETPTYDDVSEPKERPREIRKSSAEEELPEYNCPPPPRPIAPDQTNNLSETEEFYDDVSSRREECNNKNYQKTYLYATQDSHRGTTEATDNNNAARGNIEAAANGSAEEEIEHYQSPKSGLCIRDAVESPKPNEELYDDIALWTEFRARQKDIVERKRDNEDAKSNGSDKRSWNRFAGNKKSRANDSNETNRRSGNESEETEDSSEGSARRNTFQKLISKMENSLARVSARNPSSLPISKSSATSS